MIDAGNQAVPRTTVPSLSDGLALVGRGRIAALVGHLRDGVGVVDVDVPAEFGDFLAAEISDWLRERDCWVLERPSGGARGRWHIFFAHPDYRYAPATTRTGFAAAVGDFLTRLAEDVQVPRGELDLRDAVRPLSSPHRHGSFTRPRGNLRAALRDLKRLIPEGPTPSPLRSRRKAGGLPAEQTGAAGGRQGRVVPLALHRWKRQLRPEWRQYLMNGVVPAGSWSAAATNTRDRVAVDRSLVEAACTREMVWAIGDPHTAWRLIREAHPTAMTKARHQGYSWWITYVWNQTVRTAGVLNTTEIRPHQSEAPPAEVVDAVAAARDELARLMWSVSARQRPALLLVGHQLLDRMVRERKTRVPCPERDLVLDTGLGDRKTIRAALRFLDGRLGTLHTDCLSPAHRDSTSYEFEINQAPTPGGREIPPPVLDPPPAPPGLWATLPRTSHSFWRTLLSGVSPTDLDDLVVKAGLVESSESPVSKSHRCTAKAALVALSKAGLAKVDENGRWQADRGSRSPRVEDEAAVAYARQLATVETERTAYRAGMASSWTAGRARAIKLARARERRWWDSLSPSSRTHRTAMKRLEFEQMSITQQATLKARLAERRGRAGIEELDHYQSWLRGITADEYVARSLDRKKRFEGLSPAERGASISAWDRHRLRYGLTVQRQRLVSAEAIAPSPGDDHAALLPDGAAGRDAVFLERQGELFRAETSQAIG